MQRFIKNLLKVLAIIFPVWLLIYLLPTKKKEQKTYFKDDSEKPYNIAHRGGGALGPEETLVAFENSLLAGADMFEYDVHITKDGHLIASHDPTIDRITTSTGVINDMTLAEVKSADAGVKFKDVYGNYPYAGTHIELATVEEIFQKFPNMRAVIELKDDNYVHLYEEMIQEMWRLVQEYNMEDKVIIASFDHEINQRFNEVANGRVAIGAGSSAATKYVVPLVLRLNGISDTDADALQLPYETYGIDLTQKNIVQTSRNRNIDVYYWTVNEEETMRKLIRNNVDGIMTDNPAVLERVMREEGVK